MNFSFYDPALRKEDLTRPRPQKKYAATRAIAFSLLGILPLAGCGPERLASVAVVAAPPKPAAPVPPGYALIQNLDVKAAPGIEPGSVQLLEDDRLTPDLRQQLWGKVIDPAHAAARAKLLASKNPAMPQMMPGELRQAEIRFVRPDAIVTILMPLSTRLAGIESVQLYGTDKPTFLLTESDAGAAGSSGVLTTTPLEIIADGFEPVTYRTEKDPTLAPIQLAAARRTAWRLVDAREGDGKEIETISCRPVPAAGSDDLAHPHFELTYSTYRFDGTHWLKTMEHHPGCWEDDQDFPTQGDFP